MERTIEEHAWTQATQEGLRFFWATTAPGVTWKVVALSWEDAGFSVNDDGEPTRDPNGNTVTKATVEDLDRTNRQHADQVLEWWGL